MLHCTNNGPHPASRRAGGGAPNASTDQAAGPSPTLQGPRARAATAARCSPLSRVGREAPPAPRRARPRGRRAPVGPAAPLRQAQTLCRSLIVHPGVGIPEKYLFL